MLRNHLDSCQTTTHKAVSTFFQDVQGQSMILRNLRMVHNSIQRMFQTAKDVCYNSHACQIQLVPIVQLVVIAINKFYLTINQSEHAVAEECEAEIRNLRVRT